jgi:hypothetical protein
MIGGDGLVAFAKKREGGEGVLNPEFLEWFMGFPLGWTDPLPENGRIRRPWGSSPRVKGCYDGFGSGRAKGRGR